MKKINIIPFIGLLTLNTFAQNPFEDIGKEVEVLTLSHGKYPEFFPNDTLRRIGSVMFNTVTNKVEYFISEEQLQAEANRKPYVVSRFLSRDPLARHFPYYSPYQYAGNSPIAFIDLDGLEKVLAITFNGDVNYRADKLQLINNEEISRKVLTNDPSNQMVEGIKEATREDDNGIGFIAIWGHGTPNLQWGTEPNSDYLYIDDLEVLQEAIENDEVNFTDNAIIYIGNCNAGTSDDNGNSFAQKLADITGVKVIAGSTDEYNDPNRDHRGSVGVNKADGGEQDGDMRYTMWYPKLDNFRVFEKGKEPLDLGGTISILPLLERAKNLNVEKIAPRPVEPIPVSNNIQSPTLINN